MTSQDSANVFATSASVVGGTLVKFLTHAPRLLDRLNSCSLHDAGPRVHDVNPLVL